jgi:hypothetical protein
VKLLVTALLLCALASAGCGGGDGGTEAEAPAAVTVELSAENDSGQTGTATLTDKGLSGTALVMTVDPPNRFPGDVQPASLYVVGCAEVRTFKTFEELTSRRSHLTEVRNGRSETTVARPLSELTSGGYSIVVHQQNPPNIPVVCGDIPEIERR